MVYRGRSGACATCKERRVKCDEGKPSCRPCLRLRLACRGYKASFKFKDQTHKFCRNSPSQSVALQDKKTEPQDPIQTQVRHQPTIPALRSPTEPDKAVQFFLMHYASMGRDLGSTRGFFEMLVPVYCSQPPDSAFSLVLTMVSSEMLSLWYHSGGSISSASSYARAIGRLRSAIDDPWERTTPATLLAVLLLQYHENFAAVFGLRPAKATHHVGAMSLAPFAVPENPNGMVAAYMQRYMIHVEIYLAMNQKRRPQLMIPSSDLGTKLFVPTRNPSSELDVIGAVVAKLQADILQLDTESQGEPPSYRALQKFRAEARDIEEQLLAWKRSVPHHWLPTRISAGLELDLSVPTYLSVCEIYPSCQIATIWNLWRTLQVIVAKITMVSIWIASVPPNVDSEEQDRTVDYLRSKATLQTAVDSICYSVPFYLGKRTGVSSIADFTDPSILLPSCYLVPGRDGRHPTLGNTEEFNPADTHRRHLIAQGPWNALGALGQLLNVLSDGHGELMAQALSPGQHDWARQQFLRVVHLLGLRPEGVVKITETSRHTGNASPDTADIIAKYMIQVVRAGPGFKSNPYDCGLSL